MPRMRSMKPEYFDDEELCTSTSRNTRLLYPWMWCYADEFARLRGNPAWIKGKAFPYDDDLTAGDIERMIDELETVGCVVRYGSGKSQYLFLPNLADHQRLEPHKTPSRLPSPPVDNSVDKAVENLPPQHIVDSEYDNDATPTVSSRNSKSGKIPEQSTTNPETPELVSARARASFKQVAGSRLQAASGEIPKSAAAAAANIVTEHTDATPDEAAGVVRAVINARPAIKSLTGLIRTMGAAGDLEPFLGDVRNAAGHTNRSEQLAAARAAPPCDHGINGGDLPHPDSGKPICPHCRRMNTTKEMADA